MLCCLQSPSPPTDDWNRYSFPRHETRQSSCGCKFRCLCFKIRQDLKKLSQVQIVPKQQEKKSFAGFSCSHKRFCGKRQNNRKKRGTGSWVKRVFGQTWPRMTMLVREMPRPPIIFWRFNDPEPHNIFPPPPT